MVLTPKLLLLLLLGERATVVVFFVAYIPAGHVWESVRSAYVAKLLTHSDSDDGGGGTSFGNDPNATT